MARKMVEVRLDHIFCPTSGDDPGPSLELFGKLWAKVNFTHPNGFVTEKAHVPLWDQQPYVTIATNTFLGNFPVQEVIMRDNEWLQIGGYIKDEDDGFWDPNDTLNPDRFIQIGVNEINSTPRVETIFWQESDQKIETKFTITQI
ncbi:hypothetical protein [Sporosarcina pasteurii]|uniref:Uncharacterized protein n=1 Tax=Sporosarcina pasteurii TaxID=1474 RepID=A0A380BJ92_SPOPA|nr:hypothetical protein [Sporosarcina pasteurii]MDS9470767.1 hypothetical protein [Sporosarcina pasteurii]QBQ05562.1 hypothetical protein E2C16_07720 [Sporosarcina pasteurii]SUJ02230.1 Uncharacterised protein [Sporosarcina pasteurii]